jgi:hypothetical protein
MLSPHTCRQKNLNGQTLLDQYFAERTTIAVMEDERARVIDATGQPCSQFAIHEDLPIVERLYNDGDLAFFANTRVLDAPVNKENYYSVTRSELFAHNTMQQEAQRIDPWDTVQGTGVLGRMCDNLSAKGYSPQPITVRRQEIDLLVIACLSKNAILFSFCLEIQVEDATVATVGVPGESIEPLIVSEDGLTEFAPQAEGGDFDVRDFVEELNAATKLHISLFGETFSQRLHKVRSSALQFPRFGRSGTECILPILSYPILSIADSDVLVDALESVEVTQESNSASMMSIILARCVLSPVSFLPTRIVANIEMYFSSTWEVGTTTND